MRPESPKKAASGTNTVLQAIKECSASRSDRESSPNGSVDVGYERQLHYTRVVNALETCRLQEFQLSPEIAAAFAK